MRPVDLHTHTTGSDGTCTPKELVRYAFRKGLAAVALTDHDTVAGIAEAMAAAREMNEENAPEVIPGVELSTEYMGKDIHIIGLYIDWKDPAFADKLQEFADARIFRNRKMCRLLTEAGYEVTYEALEAAFPDTVITRAHFAQYLCEHGMVSSVEEVFSKLIGDDCPYFVPREDLTPADAVRLVLQYGGVPILAHPLQYKLTDAGLRELVSSLEAEGLLGIEVYYSGYKPADTAYLCRIADEYGLLVSGGSDYHGARKKNLDLGTGYGHLYVPDSVLPPIREAHIKLTHIKQAHIEQANLEQAYSEPAHKNRS